MENSVRLPRKSKYRNSPVLACRSCHTTNIRLTTSEGKPYFVKFETAGQRIYRHKLHLCFLSSPPLDLPRDTKLPCSLVAPSDAPSVLFLPITPSLFPASNTRVSHLWMVMSNGRSRPSLILLHSMGTDTNPVRIAGMEPAVWVTQKKSVTVVQKWQLLHQRLQCATQPMHPCTSIMRSNVLPTSVPRIMDALLGTTAPTRWEASCAVRPVT